MKTYRETWIEVRRKCERYEKEGFRYIEIQEFPKNEDGYRLYGHLFYRGFDVIELEYLPHDPSAWAHAVMERLVARGFCPMPEPTPTLPKEE